ncbi:hypothetical protein Q2T40_06980 [Winogradskyella maritima]|uniref:DUF6588 family protein n=1 Tax=Winogradskyella maritima TaxID=1517766 RepID=A0ABV8ANT1_9FLAO|nr:hypothetical protein [Winogradskyella maritima]
MLPVYRRAMFLVAVLFSFSSFSQSNEDIDNVVTDLIFLSQQYINPAAEGVSIQASSAWYTSAKKRKQWHLELSVQGSVLFLPEKFKTFRLDQNDLLNLRVLSEERFVNLPTSIGGTDVLQLEGMINDDTFRFTAPEGIDEDFVSQANIQAALTFWKGTSIIVRYSPKVKVKETSYDTFGFGLHHNLSQWFMADDSDFSLSVLANYSNFNVEDTFSNINVVIGNLNSVAVQGDSYTFQINASQQLNKLSISGGAGLISGNFDYQVGGDGDLILSILNGVLENTSNSESVFKADLGLNYDLGDFSISSMLTFGNFANVTFGVNYNL